MTRHLSLCVALLLPAAAQAGPDRALASRHQPTVDAAGAHAPACPNWSSQRNGNDEANAANWGCATATDLALMIADPADLVHGRFGDGTETSSPEVAGRALKAWREMQPTVKQWQVTTSVSSKGGS